MIECTAGIDGFILLGAYILLFLIMKLFDKEEKKG